ncbi:Ubiquinone biosynthesis O-methyltransferase [compost metagenome]
MSFWENHFELSCFDKYPEISGKILDFGCGSGNLDIYLARKGMFIHGIDLSEIGINIANYYKHKEVDEVKKRLCFTLNDVTKDVPKDLYDSAWSTNVFEHILYPGPIFEGLRKWIKPGGYILISVPLGYAYNDSNHVHHFMNNDELKVHLEKYIDVIKVDSDLNNKVIRALCRF